MEDRDPSSAALRLSGKESFRNRKKTCISPANSGDCRPAPDAHPAFLYSPE
jgi:hypothetical protein